jgi:hypothetical protein
MAKNKKVKKSSTGFWVTLIFLILVIVWFFKPVTERFSIGLAHEDGKSAKFALITDLHSCYYGKDQKALLDRIEKENPDAILLGGDIFDDKLKDKNAKIFCEALAEKYPVYYVTGNHEYWSERVDEIKSYLRGIGVHVLEGDCETIKLNGLTFDICGVDDPTRLTKAEWKDQLNKAYEQTDESHVRILVTHRPEEVKTYEQYDFDLIVAGHAHAGQVRIPFINKGVYAPNQGFMCNYVSGLYDLSNGSKLVVSRGLARESTLLPRFFNHPEVVTIEIH